RHRHEYADHARGQTLRADGVHQLGVEVHPALGAQAGDAVDARGDAVGLEQFGHGHVDHGDAGGQGEQRLCLLQVDVDVAGIERAHAELEDAGDVDDGFASVAAVQAQLAAHAQPQVLGQLRADDGVARTHFEAAVDHAFVQRDHAQVTRQVDADQGHRFHG